jgi:hypothetical protein
MPKQPIMRGQIMLVTLLTLMVLGVITVGIIATTNRDVYQTVSNQQYEELYNRSEEIVFTILDKYSKTATGGQLVTLSSLRTDFGGNCVETVSGRSYTCNLPDTSGQVNTEVKINDTDVFQDFELAKDDTLTLNLSGYSGQLNVSWQNSAAIDLSLVYTTSAGEYRVASDLFDLAGVFASNGGDPFAGGTHDFQFSTLRAPNSNNFRVNIGSAINTAAGDTPRLLMITPRMAGATGSILLSIETTLPVPQVREIVASSQVVGAVNAPLPSVRTQIPLHPQVPSIFSGYALLVDSGVQKQPGCFNQKTTVNTSINSASTAWLQVPGVSITANTLRIEFIVGGSSRLAAGAVALYDQASSASLKYTISPGTPPATGATAFNNAAYTLIPKTAQTTTTGFGNNIAATTGSVWLIAGGDANYADNSGTHTVRVITNNRVCP